MNFKAYRFHVKLISESLSFNYRVPKDWSKVVADFYFWNLCQSSWHDKVPIRSIDPDTLADLKAIVDQGVEKTANSLRRCMINALSEQVVRGIEWASLVLIAHGEDRPSKCVV